jgi:hypothetical protein
MGAGRPPLVDDEPAMQTSSIAKPFVEALDCTPLQFRRVTWRIEMMHGVGDRCLATAWAADFLDGLSVIRHFPSNVRSLGCKRNRKTELVDHLGGLACPKSLENKGFKVLRFTRLDHANCSIAAEAMRECVR